MKKLPIYISVIVISLSLSCRGQSKSPANNKLIPPGDVVTTTDAIVTSKINYNIFVDNSYSMDGYISKPSTQFKTALMGLVRDINADLLVAPSFYFINNKVCQQTFNNPTKDLITFVQKLTPQISRKNCEPQNSRIDNMIDECAKLLDNNVNIIISDGIFSEKTAGKDELNMAEANLKVSIAQKLAKSNFSSIILKYHSDFSGEYYIESNSPNHKKITNGNRPFYMLIFGKSANLSRLFSKLNFKAYSGFEASYCLISMSNDQKINAAVTYLNKKGTFSSEKPTSKMIIIKASPEYNNQGLFQFSINIDLSKLGCEETYLLDSSNYFINDNWKVVSISKIAEESKYTHNIILRTNDLKQTNVIKLGLKFSLPQWVIKTDTKFDDHPLDPLQQKLTFGFKPLMSGISAGYLANNASGQSLISIQINK